MATSLRDDLHLILSATEKGAALTEQLLTFARTRSTHPEPLDVNSIVSGMHAMLRRTLGRQIELEVTLGDHIGMVLMDRSQLEQVIMNLALNASNAMPHGGRLELATWAARFEDDGSARTVSVPAGDYAVLCVRDEGTGMDEATRLRIFEPFFTTRAPDKGVGMGLATVYAAVQQARGNIEVDSELGVGTTFTVHLPMTSTFDAVSSVAPGTSGVDRMAFTGNTILLVDDNSAIRDGLRRILEYHGARVLEVESGAEALATSRRHKGTIHLVVADIVMPGQSGPQLVRQLVAERPETRVLFISGNPGEAIDDEMLSGGRAALVCKPYTRESITNAVQDVLSRHSRSEPIKG